MSAEESEVLNGLAEGAGASPENEVEAEVETEVEGSEAGSPPADEQNVEKKTDSDGYLKRIDRLTHNWRSTERELAQTRDELSRTQRMLEDSRKPADKPVKGLADFDYDENAYRQYLFQEAEDRATKAAETTAQRIAREQQERASMERAQRQFASKASEFAKATPDYYEVVEDRSLPITQVMAQEIRESEMGPELAYHLGKNPHLAQEISELSSSGQIRRIVQLEARLQAAKSEAGSKSTTNAPPPPPKGVKGVDTGKITSTSDPRSDKLSDAEWFKLAERERLKRMKDG